MPANPDSFAAWVGPVLPVLRAIAVREVGDSEADDLVQEALIRAWRKRSTFRQARGSVKVWLVGILMDRARRGRARRRDLPSAERREAAAGPDASDRLDVEMAVRQLPVRQQQVVTLFYLADLSVVDVAAALGIQPGSVKAHLSSARATLRQLLEHS